MEVNPSLQDELSANQTIAVGCSLTRAALGPFRSLSFC
jgi:arginase